MVLRTNKRRNKKHTKTKKSRRNLIVRRKLMKGMRGGQDPNTFHFFNNFHYGDNILNLKFLFNISPVLKKRGIKIKYYYDKNYNKNGEELERFVDKDTVTLHSLQEKPGNAVDLWMGAPIDGKNIFQIEMELYYNKFYQNIVNILGLQDEKINTSLYQEEPYLQDIYNNLDDKYKDLDILIINATPHSTQYSYNKENFDNMCIMLNKKYKIATTSPVNDAITCTMTGKLMLKDIGAVSTHAKYIVGVHSGPVTACFNSDTNNHLKRWVLFASNNVRHANPKFTILDDKYDLKNIEEHLK